MNRVLRGTTNGAGLGFFNGSAMNGSLGNGVLNGSVPNGLISDGPIPNGSILPNGSVGNASVVTNGCAANGPPDNGVVANGASENGFVAYGSAENGVVANGHVTNGFGNESVDGSESGTVLVTGGAGFIGSHTTLQLLLEGYKVVVIDSLDNSVEESLNRVADLAGKNGKNLCFLQVDLRDKEALEMVFNMAKFDAVIHFAALKAVAESVAKPLFYYRNNMIGTINLLEVMGKFGCKKLVFSSSATVYGQPHSVPCTEDFPLSTMSPYGRTKLFVEEIARDLQVADKEWRIILLRYFNPVGAHPSGRIGEDPRGIPNNLMPFLQQVAVGRRKELTVFGNDYPTNDGTGVRDYVHVMDLAVGHVAALKKLLTTKDIGCTVYNLGTGQGTSVLEMVSAFEKASGKKIPLCFADRRPGDCAEIYASTKKAERELNWKAKYGIEDMCRHQWNWASNNPWGYRDPELVKEE